MVDCGYQWVTWSVSGGLLMEWWIFLGQAKAMSPVTQSQEHGRPREMLCLGQLGKSDCVDEEGLRSASFCASWPSPEGANLPQSRAIWL